MFCKKSEAVGEARRCAIFYKTATPISHLPKLPKSETSLFRFYAKLASTSALRCKLGQDYGC